MAIRRELVGIDPADHAPRMQPLDDEKGRVLRLSRSQALTQPVGVGHVRLIRFMRRPLVELVEPQVVAGFEAAQPHPHAI